MKTFLPMTTLLSALHSLRARVGMTNTPPAGMYLTRRRETFSHSLTALCSLVLTVLLLSVCSAASQTPYLQVNVDHPIVTYAGPQTTALLSAQPVGFASTGITWVQVTDTINHLNSQGAASFGPQGATTQVTLPAKGVYEFRATATSTAGTFSANIWVQVWDNRTAMMPGSTLGTSPGITPPTSVRHFSSPPPAFQHPRVLFTDADWPEMHTRDTTGVVAGFGVTTLRKWVADTIDKPQSADGQFAAALYAWAQGGMTGTPPDPTPLAADSQLSCGGEGPFVGMLLDACYLQWLDNDPSVSHSQLSAAAQQRGAYLATLVSAAAALRLSSVWNRSTGQFITTGPAAIRNINVPGEPTDSSGLSDLAMAYDLIYDWMNTTQQQQTRDFLFAAGWGRHTSFAGWSNGTLQPGKDQNGDFGNLNDNNVFVQLAIEGEEAGVSSDVQAAFGHAVSGSVEQRWVQMADPTNPAAWPLATVADVDNLQREISWLTDWYTTPWGMATDHLAYLGLSAQYLMPACVAYARRGENIFVTTHTYQVALHPLMVTHPGEATLVSNLGLGQTNLAWFDHHDSTSFGQRGTMSLIWKYMYPDDPLIDYAYRAYLPSQYEDPLTCAMFGLDPSTGVSAQTLPDVAAAKNIPLTLYDPHLGVISMHNGWDDNAMNMWFECNGADPYAGHMHAERNSFDFYALGRTWACAPGYHETISDLQSSVLIRDPNYASDPATSGFIGESASSATHAAGINNFPTPPGTLLQVTEAPDHAYTLVAGDATLAYQDAYQTLTDPTTGQPVSNPYDTGIPQNLSMPPGLYDYYIGLDPRYTELSQTLKVGNLNYNGVRHVFRTALFVRGPQPYALVVDDADKDGTPHDWQWVINSQISFGDPANSFVDANGNKVYSSLQITPGATPTDAVLYHTIDSGSASGLPRLLLRDVGLADPTGQPAIILQSRPLGNPNTAYLTYGIDNNAPQNGIVKEASNRVIIERDGVAQPNYTVLMFPFRTGQSLPVTTWNNDRTVLTVNFGNGLTNTINFNRNLPDYRTRLTWAQDYQVNAGGGAVGSFAADTGYSGGTANSTSATIDTSAANAAPMAVYQTGRFGTFSYAFTGLTPNANYTLRLHFVETFWNAAGKRIQNITVNGAAALTNFDIFATAGAENKAVVQTLTASADSSGKITVAFAGAPGSTDSHALVAGLEVISTPSAPTVATSASATPNPVTGKTTALSVLGSDAGGESGLTYTWSVSGPAAVTFSANGTNAAKNAVATFSKAGTYTFTVVITNALGQVATAKVTVPVIQTVTTLVVSPGVVTVAPGQTQQFTAAATDQFGNAFSPMPVLTWAASGYGTISSTGLFTAGGAAGSAYITATSGSLVSAPAIVSSSQALYQVNAGGGAVGSFIADAGYSGGSANSTGATINTTAANAAPMAVYQTGRFGKFSYAFTGLTPNANYTLRLHFAETYWTSAGKRIQNITVNGAAALTNFDIFATAGAENKAVVQTLTASADSSGKITVAFAGAPGSTDGNALVAGLEVITLPSPPSLSVSGTVTLQGWQGTSQPLTFTLTPTGSTAGSVTTQTLTPAADGSFTLSSIAAGTYTLGVKGSKWLRQTLPVSTAGGSVSGMAFVLTGGDANNDNQVSGLDLGLVRANYGKTSTDPTWNPLADLNGDGQVSGLDLGLVRANYGKVGDN